MTDFPVTVFHNPACSKSRAVLEAVQEAGYDPVVVDYLTAGWSEQRLRILLAALGLGPRDVLRTGDAEALGLSADLSDDALIAAMVAHPVLVERPIVETPLGVVMARPTERVYEILEPGARPVDL